MSGIWIAAACRSPLCSWNECSWKGRRWKGRVVERRRSLVSVDDHGKDDEDTVDDLLAVKANDPIEVTSVIEDAVEIVPQLSQRTCGGK